MNEVPNLTHPAVYRIHFAGRAKNGWSDFMRGVQENVTNFNGALVTEITGTVPDQSALFGLLCHIRDMGLPLISVEFILNAKGE